jgi:hypothetical protein
MPTGSILNVLGWGYQSEVSLMISLTDLAVPRMVTAGLARHRLALLACPLSGQPLLANWQIAF